VVVLFAATALALILRYWGGPVLVNLYIKEYTICSTEKCYGFGAVYRISWSLFMWFLMHSVLLLAKSCHRVDGHYWIMKLVGLALFLIASWFIPDQFYSKFYAHTSIIVSGIFLVLQIAILIDFAYSWNEDWMSDEKNWKIPTIIISILFYVASLIWIIFMFRLFVNGACPLQKFFLAMTIISTFIITIISITIAHKGGILPASVVSIYLHYLAFSALTSDPDASCNSMPPGDFVQLIISLVLTACSISYAAWNLASSNSMFGKDDHEHEADRLVDDLEGRSATSAALETGTVPAIVGTTTTPSEAHHDSARRDQPTPSSPVKQTPLLANADANDEHEESEEVSSKFSTRHAKFHLVMAAAAMFMATTLTNWNVNPTPTSNIYDTTSLESMWIKIATQWVSIILFTWSLVAPLILTNRDFS